MTFVRDTTGGICREDESTNSLIRGGTTRGRVHGFDESTNSLVRGKRTEDRILDKITNPLQS